MKGAKSMKAPKAMKATKGKARAVPGMAGQPNMGKPVPTARRTTGTQPAGRASRSTGVTGGPGHTNVGKPLRK